MPDFTSQDPWTKLFHLSFTGHVSTHTYLHQHGSSGLIMRRDVVEQAVAYWHWLVGHRAAGNVLFAEIVADAWLRFIQDHTVNASRLAIDTRFASSVRVLTHGSFFHGLHFNQYDAVVMDDGEKNGMQKSWDGYLKQSDADFSGNRDSDDPYLGQLAGRRWLVYRYSIHGMYEYTGPGLTEHTLESALSLRVARPLRLWHAHT